MNYNELKVIAQPHLREDDNLPSNAFLLLNQLHIPFKSKSQCEAEFGGKMTPLYNAPAFLEIDSDGEKTVYFNDSTRYYNFYIFHEIAHYLLGHEADSPQNEMDADLLACILAAPLENLPSNLKSARDLSSLCKIPIDKAEIYWQEIRDNFSVQEKKNIWMYLSFGLIGVIIILFGCFVWRSGHINNTSDEKPAINISQYQGATPIQEDMRVVSDSTAEDEGNIYYITSSGTRYHVEGCSHLKGKDNYIIISFDEVERLRLIPCKVCIKE